ncbi:ribosomal protein S5-alanine N-acetyltransferase [Moritella sp. 5]|uniref:ribosomal protein S5-alanine N-acetyltransferase n=1 Tax=Moritella sp. 5 TaxID=2746231 RepID=UPI001BACF650|nr:ribosomal protein S5-alanine N-acetyltransferase [Moritella sp. 5]QUM79483.1 ribosomal protein S5-alanine N-acetyltransferase [Moritella sp. 5]
MSSKFPKFVTKRLVIRVAVASDSEMLRQYYVRNQMHLTPWEPIRSDAYYTLRWWQLRIKQIHAEFDDASAVNFIAMTPDKSEIVAVANFSNIIQGVFKSCYLGYSIAKCYEGQGLMVEFLQRCLEFMFENVGLNRVMANYIPENERSGALLQRLGFEREGYARKYLKIAGSWQDHILTALLKEDWLARETTERSGNKF